MDPKMVLLSNFVQTEPANSIVELETSRPGAWFNHGSTVIQSWKFIKFLSVKYKYPYLTWRKNSFPSTRVRAEKVKKKISWVLENKSHKE